MLFSRYPTITQNYFMLCFVVCLGILQWSAARNRKPALSLLGRWGVGWPGLVGGGLLIVGGFAGYFVFTPGLFSPGLAGGELSILFGAGGLSALGVTRLAVLFWHNVGHITGAPDEFYHPG